MRPTSGRVLLGGTPLRERPPEARTAGVVIDSCGAHPGRSARMSGSWPGSRLPRTRVEEVLALSGLTDPLAGCTRHW
ncbi:hypothetical protein [Phytohabitans houttuyneae]|uniref:Uncharacterized protein n=1 Tax=Phytohabitans houttuyneae TaxID=1076126 RepID=A0A6V8K6K7_9ACTN|nr:hypothetical protein [Phytohabitans houttuyneae]GFJ80833.1 hypothetical protein Phou_050130 [Phytohabitans houttuyneae]